MANDPSPQYPNNDLLLTDMASPLDPTTVTNILSKPPFIAIPGALNLRDLGLLPNSPIPPGLIYRSGAINGISAKDLASLNIRMILDLRSLREVLRDPTKAVDGVENVHVEAARVPRAVGMYLQQQFYMASLGKDVLTDREMCWF